MTHRIAYLLKKFPRLSETFVLGEILRQEALGQDLHVFSRREPDDEPRHPELARLRATIERVPSPHALDPWKELFVEQGDGARATFDQLQKVVREFSRFENLRLGRVLAEALYLRRRTAELGIDHLHAHFATESAIVAMMVHELGGPTYSVTAHAKDIYRSTVDQSLLDRLVGSSQFTVTVCNANVRFLEERLSEQAMSRVRRLYNGIDLGDFTPPKEPRDENHVLAVGRLVEKKGFDVLLDAQDILRQRGVSSKLTLVGQGPERENLEAQIQRLGLQEQVTLTGGMDQDGVRKLLACATIFALPCVIGEDGNRDALPTVLLEALACGLPIVSTPVTGIPEIVGDEGIIVPERDAEATANAMEELLGDAELRARFAVGGRERAERLFDGANAAQTLNAWLTESPGLRRLMRIAYVNQDPGIRPGAKKGAAVHVAALRRAFRALGAEVAEIDTPDEDVVRAELEAFAAGGDIDLIYERYSLGNSISSAVATQLGIPHVLEVNSPLADEAERYRPGTPLPSSESEFRLFGSATHVFAVSSAVAAYAKERGAPAQNVTVVANAVDLDCFRPRTADGGRRAELVPEGAFVLGFHGRMRPWHRFDVLVRAACELRERGCPAFVLTVGRGDFAEELEGSLPAEAWACLDWVPHEEVGEVVACFDVLPLTHAHDPDFYFSPLKLQEAMAAAVVPVVPDLGDLCDGVVHGESGWLYNAGDMDGLVNALGELYSDPELRQRLGAGARSKASAHTWIDVAEQVLATALRTAR